MVDQFDEDGNLIATFKSIKESSDLTGLCSQCISACCNGRIKKTGGFKFSFHNPDDVEKKHQSKLPRGEFRHKVVQMSLDGVELCVYDSITDAERSMNAKCSHITDCCLGKRRVSLGYKWKYAE